MKVLELFAGTRSIGKAFEARGHEVFSVEWDLRFPGIDLYEDVLKISAEDILRQFGKPDVIWASPDCTTYSVAAISHHREREREPEPRTDFCLRTTVRQNKPTRSVLDACSLAKILVH